ncbi:MAG TPA: hypothetical protein VKZ59_13615 [Acidobacteriota bacterium]|nr:hypothetical protein [Acidobacteriota bacterium]
MTTETILLLVFVGVTAIALIAQAIAIYSAARTVERVVEDVEKRARVLEAEAHQIIDQLKELSESLTPVARVVDRITKTADEATQMFDERRRNIDELVRELVEVGRKQAAKVDAVVTDTVTKFEETTRIIQHDIVRPVAEISSFLKAVKSGLDYLFSRKNNEPSWEESSLYPTD